MSKKDASPKSTPYTTMISCNGSFTQQDYISMRYKDTQFNAVDVVKHFSFAAASKEASPSAQKPDRDAVDDKSNGGAKTYGSSIIAHVGAWVPKASLKETRRSSKPIRYYASSIEVDDE